MFHNEQTGQFRSKNVVYTTVKINSEQIRNNPGLLIFMNGEWKWNTWKSLVFRQSFRNDTVL